MATLAQIMTTYRVQPVSDDPAEEAERFRLHEIHDAGYEANYDGALISSNPHTAGTIEFNAWESGHLQAQNTRDECELCDRERAQRADWRRGADLD